MLLNLGELSTRFSLRSLVSLHCSTAAPQPGVVRDGKVSQRPHVRRKAGAPPLWHDDAPAAFPYPRALKAPAEAPEPPAVAP
jgi:hypothetical protein